MRHTMKTFLLAVLLAILFPMQSAQAAEPQKHDYNWKNENGDWGRRAETFRHYKKALDLPPGSLTGVIVGGTKPEVLKFADYIAHKFPKNGILVLKGFPSTEKIQTPQKEIEGLTALFIKTLENKGMKVVLFDFNSKTHGNITWANPRDIVDVVGVLLYKRKLFTPADMMPKHLENVYIFYTHNAMMKEAKAKIDKDFDHQAFCRLDHFKRIKCPKGPWPYNPPQKKQTE